jgi:hypothetical protein
MRWLGFIILFLFWVAVNAQQDSLVIKWTDDYTLSWNDFQGEEDVELSLAALSKIAIPYTYSSDGEVDFTVKLNTVFVKNESWYKEGKQNKILLGHEQLHFNIAEIHRRLIVKRILKTTFSSENYDTELKQLVNEIWEEDYRKMQDLYDSETNYARIFKSQMDWNKFVAKRLDELKKFKSTEVTINF